MSLERLQVTRRLVRYRRYAEDALRQAAETADRNVRRTCLDMAAQWRALAAEIERVANGRQTKPK